MTKRRWICLCLSALMLFGAVCPAAAATETEEPQPAQTDLYETPILPLEETEPASEAPEAETAEPAAEPEAEPETAAEPEAEPEAETEPEPEPAPETAEAPETEEAPETAETLQTEEAPETEEAPLDLPRPEAPFTLGNASEMMLAGGGRMVSTERGLYFLGEADDCIYFSDGGPALPVLEQPAACLNYIDGMLYYALPGEASFELWRLNVDTFESERLLGSFSGELRQMYAASNGALYFLCGESIWRLFPGQTPELLRHARAMLSFVPTHFGMVYACGSLFSFGLWLEDTPLVDEAEDYYVLDEDGALRLVYTEGDRDYQISLNALAYGADYLSEFTGYGAVPVEELFAGEAEPEAEEELSSVEPQRAQTRSLKPEAQQKRAVSQGMVNIALRAYQMTEIKWSPVKDVYGWKHEIQYRAGLTYTGLPYGQPTDKYYVPWVTSLSTFLALVQNPTSSFYTERSSVVDGLAHANDCSGFVSWAWQTDRRMDTSSLASSAVATVVSSTNYAAAQIGDCLNNTTNHVVLITNIRYDNEGKISAIETASATTNSAKNYCCAREWYGAGYSSSLTDLMLRYFGAGYKLYRYSKRDSVTFTPEPAIPVSHDAQVTDTTDTGTTPDLHYGVDVSQWQGTINWTLASKSVEFAIIRSQHGTTVLDSQWDNNVSGCINNHVPYGVYVYGVATTPAAAIAEAELCLSRIQGRKLDLPVFYDVEDPKTNLALDNATLYQVVSAFCTRIEQAGYKAGIYCSTDWWNKKMSDPRYSKWCRWVAQWNDICTYDSGMNLWQYSSTGRINGIYGSSSPDVDLNVWFGKPGDSSHSFRMSRVEPTCTQAGSVNYSSTDGKIKWSEPIAALGHDFVGGRCTRCGASQSVADEISFVDVPKDAWYYDAVVYVVKNGLFNGMSATRFEPQRQMTRAMLVTVLWRLAGKPAVSGESPFEDVPAGTWYTNPVIWAYKNGIVNGMDATHFDPNRNISREQLATILYRYSGKQQNDSSILYIYEDYNEISGYAKLPLAWAVSNFIIKGITATTLDPKGLATRAQVATIVQRYAKLYVK